MNYENRLLNYMKNNSDTITIEEVNELNIPRIILTRLISKELIERVKPGLYVIKDSWGDEYLKSVRKISTVSFRDSMVSGLSYPPVLYTTGIPGL